MFPTLSLVVAHRKAGWTLVCVTASFILGSAMRRRGRRRLMIGATMSVILLLFLVSSHSRIPSSVALSFCFSCTPSTEYVILFHLNSLPHAYNLVLALFRYVFLIPRTDDWAELLLFCSRCAYLPTVSFCSYPHEDATLGSHLG